MFSSEGKIKRKNYSRPLVALLSFLILVILAFSYRVYQANVELFYVVALIWIISVIVLLWFGNKFILQVLDARVPWAQNTNKRFFLQFFLSAVYSLLCINSTYYFFKFQITQTPPDLAQIFVLNIYGLLFIIPVLSISFGIYFMNQWKMAHQQSDKLKQENLRTQLESIKMQLDPHFLFNNLNVLSALIEREPKTAQDFLDKFADVYRYVLQYKNEELIPLNVEAEFIQAYVYLLSQRFGEQLRVSISLPQDLRDTVCIPPMSLQLLIENAIKHNKISEAKPLCIDIFIEEETKGAGSLIVRNSFQPKPQQESSLKQTGLDNIRKRYRYLSDSEVTVTNDDAYFTVRLPLLELF